MRNTLILSVFFSGALLIGAVAQGQALVNPTYSSPATITADSSDVLTPSPLTNPFLPTSILPNQNDYESQGDLKTDFQMPVFIPDSSLTESMPILTPPPVDGKMILPFNQQSIKPCEK